MDEERQDVDVRRGKQILAQQVFYSNRERETIEKILNAKSELIANGEKPTRQRISKVIGMTRKTVAKYLKIVNEKNG